MAGYLKKIFIIGNLGRDPETRYTGDGTQVTTFSVAVSERRRSGQSPDSTAGAGPGAGPGGQSEETTWFRVSAWRRQAEIAAQYLTKGMSVFVSGDLRVSEFTGNDGQKRTTLEVTMQDMQILTPKGTQEQGGGSFDSPPTYSSRPAGGQSAPQGGRQAPAPSSSFENEDDIPF